MSTSPFRMAVTRAVWFRDVDELQALDLGLFTPIIWIGGDAETVAGRKGVDLERAGAGHHDAGTVFLGALRRDDLGRSDRQEGGDAEERSDGILQMDDDGLGVGRLDASSTFHWTCQAALGFRQALGRGLHVGRIEVGAVVELDAGA